MREFSKLSLIKNICKPHVQPLTVGSYGDEGSSREEQDKNHVAAEKKPAQCRQVVEPGGCVGVQRFMEKSLKVGLASKCTNCP